MIIIDNTLISDEIYTECFVCDLPACHGGCCVHGDAGAPLDKEETQVLKDIFAKIKTYMRPEGIDAVEQNGAFVEDTEGEYTTPLINRQECAYVFFDKDNVAKCAIEKAFEDGKTDFKKPISCHLYPIRITRYSSYEAVNYHRWQICDPARKFGKKINVRVYEFLKEPLIRKYGEDWYNQLDEYVKFTLGYKK